jgi:hypothetical protein
LRQILGCQICRRLRQKVSRAGVIAIERDHPADDSLREAFHLGQFVPQLAGQPWDDGGSPSIPPLPLVDQTADVPVKLDQFGVRRENGPGLGLLNAGFYLFQEIRESSQNRRFRIVHAALRRTAMKLKHLVSTHRPVSCSKPSFCRSMSRLSEAQCRDSSNAMYLA